MDQNGTRRQFKNRDLKDIMATLGHRHIEILKIDIEGGEFEAVKDLVNSAVTVCQIMIEMHQFRHVSEWLDLMESLEIAGYVLFSKEVNALVPVMLLHVEYAWIHERCMTKYGLDVRLKKLNNFSAL